MSVEHLIEPQDGAPDDRRTAPANSLYERDYYSWTQQQIARLEAGQIGTVDARNIAEELRDLGNEIYFRLESALRVLLTHMLKWDHQPERRSRSWALTIAEQRDRAAELLKKNPGLKGRKDEVLASAYRLARLSAANETELMVKTFPKECPYTQEEIETRAFLWALRGEDEEF